MAEKTDIENTTSPEGRKFALEQLQKIMFGANSPYAKFDDKKKEAPIVSVNNLPKRGTVNREWLDIGTNKQKGPSPAFIKKIGMTPINFGANARGRIGSSPYKNIPNSPYHIDGTPDPPDFHNDGVLDEDSDYGFEPPERNYAGNIKDPRYRNNNLNDPGKKRRRKGKKNDITLKWAGNGQFFFIIFIPTKISTKY